MSSSSEVLEKTARGALWVVGWRFSTRLLGLVNTVVLVRVLAPSDFGLVALATSFIQAMDALSRFGLEDSLIRERSPTVEQFDTAFTLNLIRAVLTAALVAALAAPGAMFFGEPRLTQILLALAAGALLDGASNIGTVNFRRDFAFRTEFVLWVIPRVAAIALSITAALVLRSYWALIVGILTQQTLRMMLSYVLHPYRPRLSVAAWRQLAGYSLWTWLLSLMMIVRDKTPTFLIGKLLGTGPVGLFSLGYELASLPTTELVEPLNRAAFSGFSAARQQGLDGGEHYLRLVASMAILTFPAGIGVTLIADPIVRLAFGPLWVGTVPIVQLLGICGSLTVFGSMGTVMFRVYGRLQLIMKAWLLVEAIRLALLILLAQRWGLLGAAVATAVAWSIEQLCFIFLARSQFRVPARALLHRLWRTVAATLVMAGVVVATGLCKTNASASPSAFAVQASAIAALGAFSYGVVLLALWHLQGKPQGPEADLLQLAGRLVGRRPQPS